MNTLVCTKKLGCQLVWIISSYWHRIFKDLKGIMQWAGNISLLVEFNLHEAEAVGWWVINEMTWNFIDRMSHVMSTDSIQKMVLQPYRPWRTVWDISYLFNTLLPIVGPNLTCKWPADRKQNSVKDAIDHLYFTSHIFLLPNHWHIRTKLVVACLWSQRMLESLGYRHPIRFLMY